jgi:hypothetical protein
LHMEVSFWKVLQELSDRHFSICSTKPVVDMLSAILSRSCMVLVRGNETSTIDETLLRPVWCQLKKHEEWFNDE